MIKLHEIEDGRERDKGSQARECERDELGVEEERSDEAEHGFGKRLATRRRDVVIVGHEKADREQVGDRIDLEVNGEAVEEASERESAALHGEDAREHQKRHQALGIAATRDGHGDWVVEPEADGRQLGRPCGALSLVDAQDEIAARDVEQHEKELAKALGQEDVGQEELRKQRRVAVCVAHVGRLARVHIATRVREHLIVDVRVFGHC